jgi:hypothetical protein
MSSKLSRAKEENLKTGRDQASSIAGSAVSAARRSVAGQVLLASQRGRRSRKPLEANSHGHPALFQTRRSTHTVYTVYSTRPRTDKKNYKNNKKCTGQAREPFRFAIKAWLL